jgi:Pao retrotransposon peptidase/Family of unknown function (DUF5641)/Putative peptidase (DUF1758)/Integrase core domain/Integrase zinc binding domain
LSIALGNNFEIRSKERETVLKVDCVRLIDNQPNHEMFYYASNNSIENQAGSQMVEKDHCRSLINKDGKMKVLLATAVVFVQDKNKKWKACRTLLDSASQSNFMTARLHKSLHLPKLKTSVTILGFNQKESIIKEKCKAMIKSRLNDYTEELDFLISSKITDKLPDSDFFVAGIDEIKDNLADPTFNKKGRIDMLLGADIFYSILKPNQKQPAQNQPLFQETYFGWIAVGKVFIENPSATNQRSFVINNLDDLVQRMWTLDKCNYEKEPMTIEEKLCEEHFVLNVLRDKKGIFFVRYPLKINRKQLGNSYWMALKRLEYLQKKFKNNPEIKEQYTMFINEYKNLDHLEEVIDKDVEMDTSQVQYLPHHCILRESSSTTKLRVVFDGSALTTSGVSLNDTQMVGAKQQKDLFEILLRFGNHKYALTADVEKMFRQIRIHDDQCDLQRILWIEDGQLKIYRLKTVTYGTASAPFLATRCLKKLAIDEQKDLPLASEVALKDFYVDDLMTGTDTISEAIKLQAQMITLMSRGGFKLHKWCANDPKILENIDESLKEKQVLINQEDTIKTLGMRWIPFEDSFIFIIEESEELKVHTKRTVLSDIAKLFDPIGLLGPVVVRAKIFMQHLWIKKLDWDQLLPENEQIAWKNYRKQLVNLNKIKIKRFNGRIPDAKLIELHGFADASSEAFGACVYLRVIDNTNNVSVKLLASKSRITPIKQQSIVRMELCAALLLARLMTIIVDALEMKNINKFYWSDSTIVLSWIKGESSKLKVFVGNRIAEIQELTSDSIWNHVRSHLNPADVLSRGISADELNDFILWWFGPQFLHEMNETVLVSHDLIPEEELPEQKPSKITLTSLMLNKQKPFIQELIEKFSSLQKLQRVTAYLWRFFNNCKNQNKIKGSLTTIELKESMQKLCKFTQQLNFTEESKLLLKNQHIQNNSSLKLLNPFMDQHSIMRVGGRLSRSNLPFEEKHQILLPQKSHLTDLIIRNEHLRHLHAGAQATLSAVRQKYWPINGKTAVKNITKKCVRCFRLKPAVAQQLMSDLPSSRVKHNRAFRICGVDFAGPFLIRSKNQRGGSNVKAYIAVFICFATKAVHLEVVGDLSTASFKAALRRLISRRGNIEKLHSDNAKNFVGAKNEIEEFKKFIRSSNFDKEIKEFCLNNQISWNFISPYSPTQGGLWEAAVKSVKHHLKRTVTATLTFEELTTLVVQIEGILNSRPLTPLSTDPEDLNALTPGHFLIGNAITTQPDYDLSNVNINRLDRWQQVQHMTQAIWKRWYKDYLNELQQRRKWNKEQPDIKVGDMVILKDDNLPPSQWMLARVAEVHPTDDNKVRTVSLKTKNGITSRTIAKICLLPIDDNKTE